MTTRLSGSRRAKANLQPKIVSVEVLCRRSQEISDAVALRAYEIFEQRGRAPGREEADWLQAESELLLPVRVEVADAGRNLTIRSELPGFSGGDVEVGVEPRRVMLAGRHAAADRASRFFRVVDLPDDVDAGAVTATLEGGVLRLTLRKAAAPKVSRAG